MKESSDYLEPCPEISKAKSIFIYGDHFENFLKSTKEELKPLVLVVGNSDVNFDERPSLGKSVKLFLAQNASYETSEKFGVLPIGIENLKLGRLGDPKWYVEKKFFEYEHRVLVPPMSPTNPIRRMILESQVLINGPFDVFREYLEEKSYFQLVAKYRFILALEGNGYENHRIWESLYQNSFPVMLRSKWAENIKSLGLPILIVNEISDISESLLKHHLKENDNFSAAKCKILWTDYWQSKIDLHIKDSIIRL